MQLGIGDLGIDALPDQGRFETAGEILTLRQAEAGGEAVAERDDRKRCGARRECGSEEGGEKEDREERHGSGIRQ